jgi:hypothetical protein
MVLALLAGRKTMTRRVIKPQPYKVEPPDVGCGWRWEFSRRGLAYAWNTTAESLASGMASHCLYGVPGDRLWVREAWALVHNHGEDGIDDFNGAVPSTPPPLAQIWYRAGHPWEHDGREDNGFRWRPSIFMPRWASRITLEITEVRAERLHSITEEDVQAEGCYGSPFGKKGDAMLFPTLWDSINGKKHPWSSNPWCWVLSFKRLEPPA